MSIFGCRMQATSSLDDPSTAKKRRELLDRIIRVDHAGEVGADRIYAGQMFMLGKSEAAPLIQVSEIYVWGARAGVAEMRKIGSGVSFLEDL